MGLLNASQLGDQSQVIQGLTLWAVDTKGRVQTLVIWSGLEQEGRGCVRGFSGLHERSWLAPRWMLNKKSDTQAAAFISFRQRLGDRLFFCLLPLHCAPKTETWWVFSRPLRTASLLGIALQSHGHKLHSLSELGVLRAQPLGSSLKRWRATCGVQIHCFSGRSWELGVPSDCMACAGGGVYGQSLCQPFLSISAWVFPQWPMCRFSASF